MKSIIRFSWANPLVGVALCSFLFSFSYMPGAHSFQVYLDSKLMIDQYVNFKSEGPELKLDPTENYNQLIVKYNECGRRVTGRMITLKSDIGKTLKEWRFEGASSGYQESMKCNVKDIIALRQKGNNILKLYYSSNEFPEGQMIIRLVLGGDSKTALNN